MFLLVSSICILQFFFHRLTIIVTTPFFAASLVETVQVNIAPIPFLEFKFYSTDNQKFFSPSNELETNNILKTFLVLWF